MYEGERADALALDQLEAILRDVAEELGTWRARAQKVEGPPARGAAARTDVDQRGRVAELEAENRALRQRVEVARARLHGLLERLTFLDDQAREAANGTGGRRAAGGTAGGAA